MAVNFTGNEHVGNGGEKEKTMTASVAYIEEVEQ
jgi:hypothetical protein